MFGMAIWDTYQEISALNCIKIPEKSKIGILCGVQKILVPEKLPLDCKNNKKNETFR